MIDTILSPVEFYQATLAANGLTPPPMDLEKIASAEQKPVEVVKLAKAYYEQTQIDGVVFESEAARKENAYKMAEAFFEQVKEGQEVATKTADGLVRFLKHAAEGYLAQNQLDLSAEEAIKVAGLQLMGEEDAAEAAIPPVKLANTPMVPPAHASIYNPGAPHNTASVNLLNLASHYAGAPVTDLRHAAAVVHTAHGLQGPVTLEGSMASAHQYGQSLAHLSVGGTPNHTDVLAHMNAANTQPGFISQNKVPLAVGGLGLGAMYLMHRKSEQERQKNEATNRALRAAAMPAA